jgi:tetratricopeptide (TPR) repeat protein
MKNLLFIAFLCMSLCTFANDSAQFYYNKGLIEKNARKFLPASQAFETAIKFNGDFTEALMEHGYACLEMRKMDKAKASFARVCEIQPGNTQAMKELIELYYNYRQYAKAIEMAQQCKQCPNADRISGISYYRQEDYPSAEKALKAALIINAEDAEATYTLARTYLDMEEYRKALPYFERAIGLDKSKNTWMYELGLLYYTLDEYKSAMKSFMLAAENGYVQSNDFNENLGYVCLYSGEFDKGEALLMNVWNRKPGNRDILRILAEILYKQRQYDRSLMYCQKLMELDAKDGKALYQAGLNFQKKGQKDRGQQMCDKAIEMDPSLASLRQKKEMPGL